MGTQTGKKGGEMKRDSMVFYRSFREALRELPPDLYREVSEMVFNYAFDGIEPTTDANPVVKAFFVTWRGTIATTNARYDRCVENGKKGGEFGKMGGRPQNPKENPKENPVYKEYGIRNKKYLLKENTLSRIKETAPPTGVACVPSDDENIDFDERKNGDTPEPPVNIPGSAVEEKEKSSAKKEKAETGDLSPETDTGGITYRLNEETDRSGTKTGKAKSPERFIKPTFEEVAAYCRERGNDIDPQAWIDYYTANGWKVGRNPMKDWQAAVRTWERNGVQGGNKPGYGYNKPASGHDPNRGLSRGGWGTDTIELDEHEHKRKYTDTL